VAEIANHMKGAFPGPYLAAIMVALSMSPALHAATIPHGNVELVAEQQAIQPGKTFYAGLKFNLEPGWHIYWINPGDAGQPPRVNWQLPAGVTAGAIEWPYPQQLEAFSAVDFGYEDEVLLMTPMKAAAAFKAGGTASLGAQVKLIVCREMCIPGKAQLSLPLPVKEQAPAPSAAKPWFDAARKKLPRPAPRGWSFRAVNQKDSFRLTAEVGHRVSKAMFFPLKESQIENAAPQNLQPLKAGFQMTLKKSNELLKPIAHLKGVIVIGDQAYDIDAPVK
jgi:DsbC/DsbD-like thiol-disulfide interchange protein